VSKEELMRRTAGAVIAAALLALALLLSSGGRAFAHADYDRSTPGKSESVPQAPTRLDIYTTQDLFRQAGENEIQVSDAAGNRVDDGSTVVDDDNRRHFSVGLQPNLPPGRYIVRWKTLSDEDDERFASAFAFYVAVQPTQEQLQQDTELQESAEATAEAGQAEPSPTATTSLTAEDTRADDDGGAPVGAIVGGIIGAIVVAALLAGGGFYFLRRPG